MRRRQSDLGAEDRLHRVLLPDPLHAVAWLRSRRVEGDLPHTALGVKGLSEVPAARDLARVKLLGVAGQAVHVAARARGAHADECGRVVQVRRMQLDTELAQRLEHRLRGVACDDAELRCRIPNVH